VRVVQTLVPLPFDSELAQPVIERWKQAMYDACLDTIYEDLDEVPSLDDEVAHFPLLVGYREELTRADSLAQVAPELLPAFDTIADSVVSHDSDEIEED
ncbi:MAG: hypothetical protein ACREJ3_09880, partial [Polyangiaceae bacterium]